MYTKLLPNYPYTKQSTTPRGGAREPDNQSCPNRYSHLINFTLAVCDKETSTQSVACLFFFPSDKMQHYIADFFPLLLQEQDTLVDVCKVPVH